MAFGISRLGYLAIETSKPEKWREFNATLLDLPATLNADGSVGLQLDEARQRLILVPGEKDDVQAIGLQMRDEKALEELAARLSAEGIETSSGDKWLCESRGVEKMLVFPDPAGVRIEAFVDSLPAEQAFSSQFFADGFYANDSGFGHVVLNTRDLEKAERFYCELLGFAVTERLQVKLGPIEVRGIFLHCNRRHHSLAIFAVPAVRHLNHVMLQAQALRDVGMAYERFKRHRVPLSLELGQHPDPDSTVSFYAATPSGFDIEIGAAGHEIDPVGWQERLLDRISSWGHKPTMRLKFNGLKAMVAQRLGRN